MLTLIGTSPRGWEAAALTAPSQLRPGQSLSVLEEMPRPSLNKMLSAAWEAASGQPTSPPHSSPFFLSANNLSSRRELSTELLSTEWDGFAGAKGPLGCPMEEKDVSGRRWRKPCWRGSGGQGPGLPRCFLPVGEAAPPLSAPGGHMFPAQRLLWFLNSFPCETASMEGS